MAPSLSWSTRAHGRVQLSPPPRLTGQTATTAEVVIDASVFLLESGSVNGVDLRIDRGWREH
jgi:hypothetical protein